MRKRLLAAAVLTMVTLPGGTVFANPVELSGNVVIENRQEKMSNVDRDGTKYVFRLNAKTMVNENVTVFARFGAESLTNESVGKDFVRTGKSAGAIDQFGLIYKNGGFAYKLGRQDLFLGSGILFDNTANIGRNYFLDGLTISGKSGETSLFAAALQEDNTGSNDNKIYALRAAFSPAKDVTLGATFAKYDYADSTGDVNFGAIDGSYTKGKASFYADYAKSDAAAKNTAYSVGVAYNFDGVNSVSLYNYKVEANASINGWTTWWGNEKGYWYTFNHKIDPNTTVGLAMRDGNQIDNGNDKKSFRTTVTYKF